MKRLVALLITLSLMIACIPAFAEFSTLSQGDKGDEVQKLQERLIELGFMTDKADGVYGSKTAAAVKAYHALLLKQAGRKTANASGNSISAEELEILFDESFSFYTGDLKNGDKGDDVKRIQSALIRLNYLDDAADGFFGDYTQAAVELFQELNDLPVTGVADKATQDLLASGGVASPHPAYKVVKMGDKGLSVRAMQKTLVRLGLMEAPEDGYFGSDTVDALSRFQDHLNALGDPFVIEDPSVATIELQQKLQEDIPVFIQALSVGSKKASEVRRLQRRLNALGFIGRKTIDGKYGKGVKNAIAQFQTNNDLPATGEADEATQKLLFSENPVGMLSKYRLNVSIDDQRVYVYELGEDKTYTLIHTFICSTGLGNSTPRGVFNTLSYPRAWHYFKEFAVWARYAYSIEGDILFHSVLYKNKGGSPTRASVNALGRKASHGCIRLQVEDAKWICDNCDKTTIVTIY
jgi:peptidoglycan hydrolase-like protein with peptidoglycan-binding domain